MKSNLLFSLFLFLALAATPGCSLFTSAPTPSSQVLGDIRLAETGLLTAETIINLRAKESGKPVDQGVKDAEAILFAYIDAARTAANSGDTVTVNQKLDLFNEALRTFNENYVNGK